MAHYKIKSITGKLPKRHVDKDRTIDIEYHVGFQKKYRKLNANEEILLTCKTLPASVHSLRIKKLIVINEISENEFIRLQKPSSKPKKEVKQDTFVEKQTTTTTTTTMPPEEESSSKRRSRKKTSTTTIPPEEE